MSRTRALALLVLVGALIAGCTSTTEPDAPTAADTVAIPQPAVVVELTAPGAAPGTVRTLAPAAGASQLVQLATTAELRQTVGPDPEQDLSTPPLVLPLTAGTPGDGRVDLTLGGPTTPDDVLGEALTGAEGSGAGLSQLPSGAIGELRITPPVGLSDAARSAVEQALRLAVQLAPVLPEEAIGVGATWTATQVIDSLGLRIDQVSAWTLREVDGARLVLDVSITQTPQTATWTLPDGGGELTVDAYPVTGSGTLTLDTARPLPVEGTVTLGGDQVFSDPASGLALRQSVASTLTWSG